jgi:hypothetical protein
MGAGVPGDDRIRRWRVVATADGDEADRHAQKTGEPAARDHHPVRVLGGAVADDHVTGRPRRGPGADDHDGKSGPTDDGLRDAVVQEAKEGPAAMCARDDKAGRELARDREALLGSKAPPQVAAAHRAANVDNRPHLVLELGGGSAGEHGGRQAAGLRRRLPDKHEVQRSAASTRRINSGDPCGGDIGTISRRRQENGTQRLSRVTHRRAPGTLGPHRWPLDPPTRRRHTAPAGHSAIPRDQLWVAHARPWQHGVSLLGMRPPRKDIEHTVLRPQRRIVSGAPGVVGPLEVTALCRRDDRPLPSDHRCGIVQ